jgi:hypothetical protein
MSETSAPRRQPELYWSQLVQLKAASICIRLYRNQLARWVRGVEVVKAVGSSGAIAAWVVWKDWPLLWAGIIALAQLLDALKHVFPFARQHKAASDLTVALELLCIDAEVEWESIHAERVPDGAIIERKARLAKLQLEAEHRHFPEGLEPGRGLIALANRDAHAYLASIYGRR